MHTRRTSFVVALILLTLGAYAVRADVRADQKTKVQLGGVLGGVVNLFGGKSAREGVTSSVAVKGDRKATLSESTGQIIDLNEEKIYDLDIRRKSYKVTTFAELRRRMEEARRKAEENAKKEQAREKPSDRGSEGKEMEIDFDVKETGQKKTINGFDTREVIVTITVREKGRTVEESGGLVLTSDMWTTPSIAAMQEIGEFERRYAQKLEGPMMAGASAEDTAAMVAMYPMMKDALAKMTSEGGKVEGTPIMTTLTVDSVKSADQIAQESRQNDDSKGSVGGLLGGLARRAQRRSADQDNKRANIMTSTTEVLKVTTSVAPADVAVPAGFREDR